MELALYCPVYGYYEKEGDIIGRAGDYFTSVSVGSLYGELLGWLFAEWHEPKKQEERGANFQTDAGLQLIEAGAHRGDLANDILGWLSDNRPQLFERLEYWIVEPSLRRRQWQAETLSGLGGKVRWVKEIAELAPGDEKSCKRGAPSAASGRQPPRIIFCNELLDSFPVHRLGWDLQTRTWFEWGVTRENGQFVWTRMPATVGFAGCPPELAEVLPEGFTIEVCPAAVQWWQQAASALQKGKLLAVDYGLTFEERFVPERTEGTLRAYRRHRLGADVLADPGDQDITAHIDFTALQDAGEAIGLKTETFVTQTQFLTHALEQISNDPGGFGEWTGERRRQFQTLTHPDHLGRAFRVLVQTRE